MTWLRAWLLSFGQWLVTTFTPPPPPPPVPTSQEIRLAVWATCVAVGLHAESLTDETDLLRTGKLAEIAHLAALRVGKNLELRTVGDVIEWLKEASDDYHPV